MKYIISAFVCFFLITKVSFSQNEFSEYYSEGVQYLQQGKFNEAITSFSKAIKNKDKAKNEYMIASAYSARALCRSYLQNHSQAIADIDDALKLKPEFTDLYYTKTAILKSAKKYDEAIVWANKGLKLKPEYEDLMLLKTEVFCSQKKYQNAVDYLDTILKVNPQNKQALNKQGFAYGRLKKYEESIKYFTKVIELDPQNADAFFDRAITKADMKDFDGALADINRGMEIDTLSKWIGYNNIAFFIKFEQKDYTGAIEYFNKAIELNPNFAYAYNNRGYAKMQLGDLSGARKDITKSLEMDSTNSYTCKTIAQLFIAEKKLPQACEQLNKAIKLGYNEDYDDEVEKLLKENNCTKKQ